MDQGFAFSLNLTKNQFNDIHQIIERDIVVRQSLRIFVDDQ